MTNKTLSIGSAVRSTLFDAFVFAYLAMFALVVAFRPEGDALALQMRLNFEIFLGLVVFGAGLSLIVKSRGVRTLGDVLYSHRYLSHHTGEDSHRVFYKTFWGIELLLVIFTTIVLGFFITDVSVLRLFERESFGHAMRLFGELASPDWSILPKAIMKIIESVLIAFMATLIAVPVAFGLSFLTARNIMGGSLAGKMVYSTLRLLFNVTRSVEPVLWAIIFTVWVSFGPFAGMLALMVHSVASLAKQYSETVEGVEDGPIEGIESTGAGRLQTIWFAIVPQVVLPFISDTMYRWDINVRMATILGFVGGGGIGTMLMEYQGQARWPQVGTIIVVIAFVVWVMDAFSAHVRAALK